MEQVPESSTYQVFINYRSVDNQNNLASLIFHTLTNRGLRVFLHQKNLSTEDNLRFDIRGALSSASVCIVIFCEHYAESPSCLNELCWILGSSHDHMRILPVFSNVEPGELREIELGRYAEAFRNYEGTVSTEKVEAWKAALIKAADISGLVLKTNERFVESIVNAVLTLVKREPLHIETYQVFINHRGPDAKLTHASLIYHRLSHCGLRVFLDAKELQAGSTLYNAIQGAISSASIYIVIFSNRYAESVWCLNELRWILNSSRERTAAIIPIFCDVEPKDLRDITKGPYAEAFQYHVQRKHGDQVVTEWKEALKKAAEISGYIVKTNGSDYGMYLEQILSIVLAKVNQGLALEVATHPVGLDEAAIDFQNKIVNLSNTKIVGITGMGGLGKSTLAKHLYNLRRFDFMRSCFLFNVRGRDLPSLQKQLIRDLLGHDLNIDNSIQGKGILQSSLQELQVLIVLDDVDGIEQIHGLLDMYAVGPLSLILLTSRDKDLLKRSPKALSYDVKPLNRQNAQELFCRHAFFLPEPVQGFEDLVKEFLGICGGLPSSLRAFGQHLAGNLDKTYWKLQVEKFSKRLPDDTLNTLKVSYEALKKEEKEMFLDIGCFLVGEDKELVVRVLEGLGYSYVKDCLESLRQKCLVEYNYDVETSNYIKYKDEHPELCQLIMHNQVKVLARHIAREEFFEFAKHKPLRLSCSSDLTEMFQLQDGSKSCLTRGIRIAKGQNPQQLTNHINIRGVRLLVADNYMDLSSFAMSGDLIWLRLNDFPSISIPSTISLARLRVLELHGTDDHLQQSFDIFDEVPYELRELNSVASIATSASASSSHEPSDVEHYMNFCTYISAAQQGAKTSFPKWIGTLVNKMVFKYFTTVQSFPIHFGELKNLRHLDLSRCINLTELPNSFSELLHLQYLALQYCINLSIPKDILGEISTLEHVDFRGCAKLVHLPEGMAKQRSLTYLNLKFCFELKTLPDLSSFVHLKFLNINGCVKLETLNDEGLKSLEESHLKISKYRRVGG